MDWARTFLKIKAPLVLFTEGSMVETITILREDRPMKLIVLPFEELDTWKLYKEQWKSHFHMDPEKHIHTPELYAVWAQKAFFVERAIQKNPFQTNYFFWCDIGACRDPNIDSTILNSFPSSNYLESDSILFQSVGDAKPSDKIKKDDGIYGEIISHNWNEIRLVGGLWGGGIKGCLQWKEAYQTMLEKYFQVNRFAGKDQIVMLSTYLNQPKLAKVVKCTKNNIDEWFFLEHLLSDLKERFELNSTYLF